MPGCLADSKKIEKYILKIYTYVSKNHECDISCSWLDYKVPKMKNFTLQTMVN